jgi:hypothetical protein
MSEAQSIFSHGAAYDLAMGRWSRVAGGQIASTAWANAVKGRVPA